MKKTILYAAAVMTLVGTAITTSCGGQKAAAQVEETPVALLAISDSLNAPQTDTLSFAIDDEGYIVIFDGNTFAGWRGYGMNHMPDCWSIEDSCIKISHKTGATEWGDIIFAHMFKNFELDLDWKVAEGSNSGIFYLGHELVAETPDGSTAVLALCMSAPEYQILDNERHPDAKLGKDGNRQSASLYDMLPAVPQNFNGANEWNHAKIVVDNGLVSHYQNGEKVVEYALWTPEWTDMLQNCKFNEKDIPLAFAALNNCGGDNHEGYIGLQDHGDDVWYRNIRVKVLD